MASFYKIMSDFTLAGQIVDLFNNAEWSVANLLKVDYPTHFDSDQKQHAFANRGLTSCSIYRQSHYEDKRFPSFLTGINMHGSSSDGQQIDHRIGT